MAEDDPLLAHSLGKGLRERGHVVDIVHDGEQALTLAIVNTYEAVILDVMLPRRDGLEVTRTLRDRDVQAPILMLTARDRVLDKVAGLDAGADDYLTKPFEFDELEARLRALRRRPATMAPELLVVGDLAVDTRRQRASRNGRVMDLTAKEYIMLEYLARHAGEVVTRADISAHLWDENHDPASNALEVYVARLRRKLDAYGPPILHPRRRAGYLLDPAPAAARDAPRSR